MDGLRPLLVDARVIEQGRPFAPVPRQVLHGHDICFPLKEMCHESLPEDMMRDFLFDAEGCHDAPEMAPHAVLRAIPRETDRTRNKERRILIFPARKIPLEPVDAPVGEEDLLRFLGLHVHDDGLLVSPIDIIFVHCNRLSDPHAGRIEDFKQDPRAKSRRDREVDGSKHPLRARPP